MRVTILFLFFLSSFCSVYAQNNFPSQPEASFSAIIVSDLSASINWYEESFGFTLQDQFESSERGIKQANLSVGDIHLELIELEQAVNKRLILEAIPGKSRMTGFFKFGFQVAEFDAWYNHLSALDVTFHGHVVEDPVTEKKMVLILDPDGNRIQLFER